jgi:hypothetical protein
MLVQKITRREPSKLEVAQKYFSVISAINSLGLTERELQLTAFMAIKGNISYESNRKAFCEMYSSSGATINNMISKLKKMGILVKNGKRINIHPALSLDFDKEIFLGIKLQHNNELHRREADVNVHEGLPDKGDVGEDDGG